MIFLLTSCTIDSGIANGETELDKKMTMYVRRYRYVRWSVGLAMKHVKFWQL